MSESLPILMHHMTSAFCADIRTGERSVGLCLVGSPVTDLQLSSTDDRRLLLPLGGHRQSLDCLLVDRLGVIQKCDFVELLDVCKQNQTNRNQASKMHHVALGSWRLAAAMHLRSWTRLLAIPPIPPRDRTTRARRTPS